jgi:hypothetical protein
MRVFRQACVRAEEWLGLLKGVNASVIEVRKITHLRSPEDLWTIDKDDPLHEDIHEIG